MEILTRLLLNTDSFDAKLRGSKKNVQSFESSITSMASKAGAGVLKLAGGLGIAVGATEAFNKVLSSSQTLGDMTASNIYVAKESIDQFFYSLGSGDFTNFLNGLENIIAKAKEYHAAMDQLGNTKISHGYFSSEYASNIAQAQTLAQNKFAPENIRKDAFNDWKAGIESQKEINKTLQHDLVNYITKAVESEIGLKKFDVDFDDFKMALKIDVTNPAKREELKSAHMSDYQLFKDEVNRIESRRKTSISQAPARSFEINQKYDSELEEIKQKHKKSIIVNAMLNKYEDEELQSLASNAEQYQKLEHSIATLCQAYNNAAAKFNKQNKSVKGFKKIESIEGYTAYIDNEIGKGKPKAKETKLVALYADYWIRQQIQSRGIFDQVPGTLQPVKLPVELDTENIEESLPQSEIEVKLKAKLENAEFAKKKIAELKQLMEVATTPEEKEKLSGQIDEWAQFGGIVDKGSIKLNNEYAESLGVIASVMGTVSNMTNEGAGAWLTWSANLLTSISGAIPMIEKLISAKKGEAMANAVSSATQTPLTGWLMAGAAVASVVSAFSSMPKLANGGIAYGNSIVNVGEYAGASGNPEIIAPLSKLREYIQPKESNNTIGGEVVFTISGTTLRGVLSNCERKYKKFS